MALEIGSRLGHYNVTALIGEGGMGQVYQDTDLDGGFLSGTHRAAAHPAGALVRESANPFRSRIVAA